MGWNTAANQAKQAEIQAIKNQLAAIDEKLPRCLEVVIAASSEALAEVIDSDGTTRGEILNKKLALRDELTSISVC